MSLVSVAAAATAFAWATVHPASDVSREPDAAAPGMVLPPPAPSGDDPARDATSRDADDGGAPPPDGSARLPHETESDDDGEPPRPEPEFDPAPAAADPLPLTDACRGAGILRVAALQRSLVLDADDLGLQIPPRARATLTAIKDRLVEHASSCLASLPTDAERGAVVSTLQKSLDDAGVLQGGNVGWLSSHELSWSRHRQGVSVFRASLRLSCGADDVGVVFERRASGLVRSLVVRADGYEEIYGGNLGLELALSRGGDDFTVTTTASSPWCTSCWRGLKYAVHTRGADGRFRVGHAGRDSAYVCSDFTVEADEGSVRIDYLSWDHVGHQVQRLRQRAFAVDGARVTPVAPHLSDPIDTVAAFLDAEWDIARGMVTAPDERIRRAHAAWRRDHARGRWTATPDAVGDRSAVVRLTPSGRGPAGDAAHALQLRRVDAHRWIIEALVDDPPPSPIGRLR